MSGWIVEKHLYGDIEVNIEDYHVAFVCSLCNGLLYKSNYGLVDAYRGCPHNNIKTVDRVLRFQEEIG